MLSLGKIQVHVDKVSKSCIDNLTQIHIFYNGLQQQPKLLLDAITDGSLMSKSVEDAIIIIERITLNDHRGKYNIKHAERKIKMSELNTNDAILAYNKLLTQIVDELTKQLSKLPK